MAASLVKGNNVQIPLSVINDTDHYLTLKKNQHIGNAVESNVIKESDIDSTDSISSHGTLESNHELTDPKDNDTKYDSDSSGSTSIPTFNVRKTSTSVDEPIEKDSDIQKEELIKVTSKVPPCVLDLFLRSTRKLNTWQSIQVAQVLIDFEDVFFKHDLDLGLFTKIKHQINTQDAKPIKKTGHAELLLGSKKKRKRP